MTDPDLLLVGAEVFDGDRWWPDAALAVDGDRIRSLGPRRDLVAVGAGTRVLDLSGHRIAPGFIDLQVNGGGDVLFNAEPTVAAIDRILDAHQQGGTTSLLPTFITGPVDKMTAARRAVETVHARGDDAVLGIHLEGPVIAPARKGAHDLTHAQTSFPAEALGDPRTMVHLVTLAPEVVGPEGITDLVDRGVLVSLGHSEATAAEAAAAIAAGATCGTHLYNAMSPLVGRAPGLVGALLSSDATAAGIIADGHHVAWEAIGVAWRAKPAGKLVLVTDAMPPVGGTRDGYRLGPWTVAVVDGRCETPDGTLAGSVLDLATAVRNCVHQVGIPLEDALRMASTHPADLLGVGDRLGRLRPGHRASLVVLDPDLQVVGTLRAGRPDPRLA